jgi:hypothetical protein
MRWYVSYNITMLRLVSFGMDYHWSRLANNVREVRNVQKVVALLRSDKLDKLANDLHHD